MGSESAAHGVLSMDGLIANSTAMPASPRRNEDLAGIFYTGGTTGYPKGAMHSFLSLWAGCTSVIVSTKAESILHIPRYLHAAPMFHLGDLVQAFGCTALAGTHVVIPGFAPEAVSRAVRQHGVSWTLLVPTMIGMLLDSGSFEPSDFTTLKLLAFGGSPISDALLSRTRDAFPEAKLTQGFGQTETAAVGAMLPDDGRHWSKSESRRHSVGQASYGVELAIVDERGKRRRDGEVGEIWVNTPSAMIGYWKKDDLTAATLADGWVHTGDAGYLDDDGYLFVCDRVKDMIISGGENIYSAEVENALASHPAIAQAAVIGVPDDRWGERVHAVVVLRSGLTISLEEMQAHCRTFIAGYKIPRSFEISVGPLPISPVGKVMKSALREPHWVGRNRHVN